MIIQDRMEIVSHEEIARNIFELTLRGKLVQEITSPGQFVHVRVSDSMDPLLRRPISITTASKLKSQAVLSKNCLPHPSPFQVLWVCLWHRSTSSSILSNTQPKPFR